MLKTRVITALIGFAIAVFAITTGGYVYNGIFTLLALLAWREYGNMLEHARIHVARYWGYFFVFLVMSALSMAQYTFALMAAIVGLLALGLLYIFSHDHYDLSTVAYSCLGFFYVQTGFVALILMRSDAFYQFLDFPTYEYSLGALMIWSVLLCTWASDTFAYFVGRIFGKRKIVPTISPSKTLEGFVGGFVGCVLVGIIFTFAVGLEPQLGFSIGLLTGIFAPFGDLFESKIKRNCAVKDSGVLLPGHGGVLDRFDSVLFVAPLIFLYLLQM